jgi:hypothetical protein
MLYRAEKDPKLYLQHLLSTLLIEANGRIIVLKKISIEIAKVSGTRNHRNGPSESNPPYYG